MTTEDKARRAAHDVLLAVEQRSAYANLLLPSLLRERTITGRDAAFATELAYGTLRFQGTYDEVIGACSKRPVDAIDPPLRTALRLGVHQLLGMRVPAHASVTTTVDMARAVAGAHVAGFANAVMRCVARRDRDAWLDALAPAYDEDPIGHLALVHSHPRWIVEVYYDALGRDIDETARACAADNVPPSVHLVARPGRCSREQLLAEAGPDASPGRWSPFAVWLGSGDPGALPLVRTGAAGVQDEGSQLASLAAAAAPVDEDRRWLDMCAGPGGKAALLAGLAAERNALLVAADRSPHRAALAARAIGRTTNAAVVVADGTRPAWPADTFDRVLVDAPCTGLGALRRRPDARWRRAPQDAERLHPLQVALLDAALTSARPGGVVTYVTCSPHPVETQDVVDAVVRQRRDVRVEALHGDLAAVPGSATSHSAQLWPHRHRTDAMFVASLRRAQP